MNSFDVSINVLISDTVEESLLRPARKGRKARMRSSDRPTLGSAGLMMLVVVSLAAGSCQAQVDSGPGGQPSAEATLKTTEQRRLEALEKRRHKKIDELVASLNPKFITHQKKRNVVHFAFDDQANIIPISSGCTGDPNPRHVLVDANDVIAVHLICLRKSRYSYEVKITGSQDAFTFNQIGFRPAAQGGNQDAVPMALFAQSDDDYVENIYEGGPYDRDLKISIKPPGASVARVVDVPVGKLYHFQGAFGVFGSSLDSPDFVASPGVDGVSRIRLTKEKNRIGLGGAVIPFLADGGRDLRETPRDFLARLNPILGVGLSEFGRNFYVGAAYELSIGSHLAVGVNLRRTKELDGGFGVGSVFPAGSGAPTRERWNSDAFLALVIPATVFEQLLSTVTGTQTGAKQE